VILGLASSGDHSNGYSLVRRIAELSGVRWSDPAPLAPALTLGAALLEPTRIYVRACLAAIRGGGAVKALAHITGGGLVENIPRVLPEHLAAEIDLASIQVPPVFRWLAGSVAYSEMLRTFNCGIGMILVVERDAVADVTSILESEGETVAPIGRIALRGNAPVVFAGKLDLDA